MEVLSEYHAAVGPLIYKYEGTLERFLGDGMMVIFNDPFACLDAPERAARLAIEMRDAGVRVNELHVERRSLEDVFLELTDTKAVPL